MGIYLDNGYVDIKKILDYKLTFNFIIGGRGTGKTYGSLKYAMDSGMRFMLMRRTQSQVDLINKPEFNPYKAIVGDQVTVKTISKYNSVMMQDDDVLGYTCALSTISNLRGFDASDVKLLIYDEFIPEKHERQIKNEGSAFLNAYETINRNRELIGEDPVQVLCLANAFNIANAIFLELGLVKIAEKMIQKGNDLYINQNTGVLIAMLSSSRISRQKADTALYRVSSGSYKEMALDNKFAYNDDSEIKPQNLIEYKIYCVIGGISIYKHKSQSKYYVSEHMEKCNDTYNTDDLGLTRYRKKHGYRLFNAFMKGDVLFENILTKEVFTIYTI